MASAALAPPRLDPGLSDPRLICPLDLPDRRSAEALVEALGESVQVYKIGLELLASEGMALAASLKSRGKTVFADWKLHDIGTTVERAMAALARESACDLVTVHAEPQVLAAAVRGRGGAPLKVLAVTVLTSLSEGDLPEMGYGLSLTALVERRVRQACDAGADGVVVSPREAAAARRIGGPDLLVVTPGVRPDWAAKNDQARSAAPAEALRAGASHIVCGRPITAAPDPRAAALRILDEMRSVPL
jgi:orotidine-5'-phosphate decarboxylase